MARSLRSPDDWRTVLRAALRDAVRARDATAIAALRETLGAIDNAEAVDPRAAPPAQPGLIAGGVPGLGAGEVPRRTLTAAEATAVVDGEIAERRRAATSYAALGRHAEAATLTHQADLLAAL